MFQASLTPLSTRCQTSSASIGAAATPPVETLLFFDGPEPSWITRRPCGARPTCLAAAPAASSARLVDCPPAAAARFETKRFPTLTTQPAAATFTVSKPLWTPIPLCTCWKYTWVVPVPESTTWFVTRMSLTSAPVSPSSCLLSST